MNKYRVLKPYPKQITNSGRLLTLKKGRDIYLKREAQVLRLIRMGFIKPIVEMPKKSSKAKRKPALQKETLKEKENSEYPKVESESEESKDKELKSKKENSRRKSKSEHLNKK